MKRNTDVRIIDFHSHILPGADHGSDSIDTSLAQLRLMADAGTDIAVATAHFYPQKDTVEAFLERRERAAALLAGAKNGDIKVALGAEVYAVAGLEKLEGLERLTVKGTNTLLLEMPMTFWNTNVIDTVLELDNRFDLILAHIDRYPSNGVSTLLDMGVRAQVNAANSMRKPNKQRLADWLAEGAVWAIGSDMHEADKKAAKAFEKIQKKLKYDIDEIFRRTEKLIEGAELI